VTGFCVVRPSIKFSTGELAEAALDRPNVLRKISARVDNVYLHDTML